MRYLLCLVLCAGCSTATEQPDPEPFRYQGAIVNAIDGQPVADATTASRISVRAKGYLDRDTTVGASIDLIPTAPPFDPAFFQHLAHNALNDGAEPLRRQDRDVRIYLQTVDTTGRPVDPATLQVASASITPELITRFTDGQARLAAFQQGTDTTHAAGWVTIRWVSDAGWCGMAAVGGAFIDLTDSPRCGCQAGVGTSPRIVKHQIGHALGFSHLIRGEYRDGDGEELMRPAPVSVCEGAPSARERFHGGIVYRRPRGNMFPDTDPSPWQQLNVPLFVRD